MEIILGDNPFFGVNHRSQKKAAEYLDEKGDFSKAVEVIVAAQSVGVDRVMLSNHADLPQLLAKLRSTDAAAADCLKIALVVPYAQKFNQIVGSDGVVGILKRVPFFKATKSGMIALASILFSKRPNIRGLIDVLVEMEIDSIDDFRNSVSSVCLHNIVADLCLGLDRLDFVQQFCDVVSQRGLEPVVITQNPIAFDEALSPDVTICFSYNVKSFMVSPSLEEVRRELSGSRRMWAMAILASGAVSIEEASSDEFLAEFSGVLYATGNPERAKSSIPILQSAFAQKG